MKIFPQKIRERNKPAAPQTPPAAVAQTAQEEKQINESETNRGRKEVMGEEEKKSFSRTTCSVRPRIWA